MMMSYCCQRRKLQLHDALKVLQLKPLLVRVEVDKAGEGKEKEREKEEKEWMSTDQEQL